jgi:hypothetical protein
LFRTHAGGGGVLQIVERIENDGDKPDSIRLRYKILVRGEGRSVEQQIRDQQESQARGLPEGWTEEKKRRATSIRRALQSMFLYTIDVGQGQWPADLEAAKAFAGEKWPEGLPETLVYVQPKRDPDFPQQGPRPVLFEVTELPEPSDDNPDPSVIVGWENGSATIVHDAEELNELLDKAGVER